MFAGCVGIVCLPDIADDSCKKRPVLSIVLAARSGILKTQEPKSLRTDLAGSDVLASVASIGLLSTECGVRMEGELMHLEHIGYMVHDPVDVARWYCDHLDFCITRQMTQSPWTHFLVDGSGRMMLEIYNNPKAQVPDYASQDPLVLHLAFAVDDVDRVRARLLFAGAKTEGEITATAAGDQLAMLRDPWGLAIQLAKRAKDMVT